MRLSRPIITTDLQHMERREVGLTSELHLALSPISKCKDSINHTLEELRDKKQKIGKKIRGEVGTLVKKITTQGVNLPRSIEIESWNPTPGEGPLEQHAIIYSGIFNSLSIVSRHVGVIEDFSLASPSSLPFSDYDPFKSSFGSSFRYRSLPKDQQRETQLGMLKDEEWIEYGPKVVEKLKEIVIKQKTSSE